MKPTRVLALASTALLLAGVAVEASTAGTSQHVSRAGAPPKLVGVWTRKVTSADVKRVSGTSVPVGTAVKLTIHKNGAVTVDAPSFRNADGTITSAGVNRFRISFGPFGSGNGVWHVTGSRLTISGVSLSLFVDSRVLLAGVWTRR